MFKHEPCDCVDYLCKKGVAPASDCVNRLKGTVEGVRCEKCEAETLHHNGECIRCQRLASGLKEQIAKTSLPFPKVTPISTVPTVNGLTLTITLGGNGVVVTDKKIVAKIIKILLA